MIRYLYKYSFTLSIIWTLIILGLCSMPGSYIPSVNFLELLSFDKWVHAGIFFVLVILISMALSQLNKPVIYTFIFTGIAVLYGILLEVLQAHVFIDRSYDVLDMIANSTGCLIALFFRKRIFSLGSSIR